MVTTNKNSHVDASGKLIVTEEYKGLSTDTKPTECEVNSLFFELDTGDFYYFTGDAWNKVGGAAS